MLFRSVVLLALLCAPAVALPQNTSAFADRAKPRPATVSILALTSVAHTGFSGNEDIYLADVVFKQGDHQTLRLLDLYPATGNPLRRTLLADRRTFRMRLTRAPECDEAAANILVATRDENIYDAATRTSLADLPANASVPCYKVVHEATRLIKK